MEGRPYDLDAMKEAFATAGPLFKGNKNGREPRKRKKKSSGLEVELPTTSSPWINPK